MTKLVLAGLASSTLMVLSFLDLLFKLGTDAPFPILNTIGLFLWPCCITLLWVVIYRHGQIEKFRQLRKQGS